MFCVALLRRKAGARAGRQAPEKAEHALPAAELGAISCEIASASALSAVGLAGLDESAVGYLFVSIPVTLRSPGASDLVVVAETHAPPGYRVPTAFGPSPSVEYDDQQETKSGGFSLTPTIVEVHGSIDRSATRRRVIQDVAGIGTSRLEWHADGRQRPLAASHRFSFLVRRDQAIHSWVAVTVELRPAAKARSRRTDTVCAVAQAPLVASTEPQSAAMLELYTSAADGASPFLVGSPLNLSICIDADGLSVARFGDGSTVVGTLLWFDDVDGMSGYVWSERSAPAAHRFLESDSILQLEQDRVLRVSYSIQRQYPGGTLESGLDIDVAVDGHVVSSHTASSDYVSVGRLLRDISIDRPEISRLHGMFVLTSEGWSYRHRSGVTEAQIVHKDGKASRVKRDDVVQVNSGDRVRLTSRVSLLIS